MRLTESPFSSNNAPLIIQAEQVTRSVHRYSDAPLGTHGSLSMSHLRSQGQQQDLGDRGCSETLLLCVEKPKP